MQRGDCPADMGNPIRQAAWGVVAPGVVVIGDPKEGRRLRIARDALIDVTIRNGIDLANAWLGVLVRIWLSP